MHTFARSVVPLLIAGLLWAVPLPAFAQEAEPEAPPAEPGAEAAPEPAIALPKEIKTRLHLVLADSYSYVVHPYFTITEDPGFRSGRTPISFVNSINFRDTDEDANIVIKLIHALPPFGIEGMMALDIPFVRGVAFGFDHSMFTQHEVDAAEGVPEIIPITIDWYMYAGTLRFFVFNPNEPGINYFFGISLGFLQGKILADPYVDQPAQILSLSQSPVGSTLMGLEARGNNWGFRYELRLVNADEVNLSSNPYPGEDGNPATTPTEIDFSGSQVRLSIFYHFD